MVSLLQVDATNPLSLFDWWKHEMKVSTNIRLCERLWLRQTVKGNTQTQKVQTPVYCCFMATRSRRYYGRGACNVMESEGLLRSQLTTKHKLDSRCSNIKRQQLLNCYVTGAVNWVKCGADRNHTQHAQDKTQQQHQQRRRRLNISVVQRRELSWVGKGLYSLRSERTQQQSAHCSFALRRKKKTEEKYRFTQPTSSNTDALPPP